jgi:hypothetical protein
MMGKVLEIVLTGGAMLAAMAVALGCVVGLVVWLAGRESKPPEPEAWRRADEN